MHRNLSPQPHSDEAVEISSFVFRIILLTTEIQTHRAVRQWGQGHQFRCILSLALASLESVWGGENAQVCGLLKPQHLAGLSSDDAVGSS